jgi:hypothetical protein
MLVSAFLWLLSMQVADAYTQVVNNYPNNPVDCGGSTSWPCLYWQEPNNTVITLNAYLDPSLNQTYYNFAPILTNITFPNFNQAPAYNPNFSACSTPSCGTIVYQAGPIDFCGSTGVTTTGATRLTAGPVFWQNNQYNAYLLKAANSQVTQFNTYVTWNSSYDWSFKCSGIDLYVNADGRKVAGHETGHESSLGHTGFAGQLMLQGAVNVNTLQSNDIAGLKHIYPGFCCQ